MIIYLPARGNGKTMFKDAIDDAIKNLEKTHDCRIDSFSPYSNMIQRRLMQDLLKGEHQIMKNLHHTYIDAAKPCQLRLIIGSLLYDDYPTTIQMSYGEHTLSRRITLKEEMVDPFRDLYMEAVLEMRNNLLKGASL